MAPGDRIHSCQPLGIRVGLETSPTLSDPLCRLPLTESEKSMETWSPIVRRPGRIPFRELFVPGRINEEAWNLGMHLGTIITPSKPFAPVFDYTSSYDNVKWLTVTSI